MALEWHSTKATIADVQDGKITFHKPGKCKIKAKVGKFESDPVQIQVVEAKEIRFDEDSADTHISIMVGESSRLSTTVVADDGDEYEGVLLSWRHTGDDPHMLRIDPWGKVTANRLGNCRVFAMGSGKEGSIAVEVTPNPDLGFGGGVPKLLLTDRDVDPATGSPKPGDPDEPVLWQDPSDAVHGIWWLNLQNPVAATAFKERGSNPVLWRFFHAEAVVRMVCQVLMLDETTKRGVSERQEYWLSHKDNKKLSTELDRGSAHGMGPIGEGLIERVGEKLYRLTLEGLDYALTLEESGDVERQSMERTLAEAVGRILDKPEYLAWKATGIAPKSFRRAGGFWNVAPGLPPGVIRDRILEIERVLVRAYLYEERREEVMGALRFCALLRAKFFRDLKLLQVTLPDLDLPEA